MDRQPFVAGNWKMNTNAQDGRSLVEALVAEAGSETGATMAVCPPFVYLSAIAEIIADSNIALGAQNMCSEDKGAFTAEVSPHMLTDCGCDYVIVGHSERRHIYGETDAMVNAKVHKALEVGLKPIVCVGETLKEREQDRTMSVIERHVAWGLYGLSSEQALQVTVAYEPVWAIGTGKVAEPEDANAVHAFIRGILGKTFGEENAAQMRIQYGGSVKESNVERLSEMTDIDGFLVGGASLKAAEFAQIIKKAVKVKSG